MAEVSHGPVEDEKKVEDASTNLYEYFRDELKKDIENMKTAANSCDPQILQHIRQATRHYEEALHWGSANRVDELVDIDRGSMQAIAHFQVECACAKTETVEKAAEKLEKLGVKQEDRDLAAKLEEAVSQEAAKETVKEG